MTYKIGEIINNKDTQSTFDAEDIVIDLIGKEDLSEIQKAVISEIRRGGGTIEIKKLNHTKRTLNSLLKRDIIFINDTKVTLNDLTADHEEDKEELAFTMTTGEFREKSEYLFGKWGWQKLLAEAIGVNQNTVGKWASGRLDVPVYVTALIESLEVIKDSNRELPIRFQK